MNSLATQLVQKYLQLSLLPKVLNSTTKVETVLKLPHNPSSKPLIAPHDKLEFECRAKIPRIAKIRTARTLAEKVPIGNLGLRELRCFEKVKGPKTIAKVARGRYDEGPKIRRKREPSQKRGPIRRVIKLRMFVVERETGRRWFRREEEVDEGRKLER